MSEENVHEQNGVEEIENEEEIRVFASVEEAEANPPRPTEKRKAIGKWKVFEVEVPPLEGGTYYIHSGGGATGGWDVLTSLGCKARVAGSSRGAPTPNRVKAMLAKLSDEERAEALEDFIPKKKSTKKKEQEPSQSE